MQPYSWDYNHYNPIKSDQLQWEGSYQEQPRGLYEDYWYGGIQNTMVEENIFNMDFNNLHWSATTFKNHLIQVRRKM